MRLRPLACVTLGLVLLGAAAASAQDPAAANTDDQKKSDSADQKQHESADDKKPPTPEHTGVRALFRNLGQDYKNLAHADNLYVAALGGAGALAVHPLDPTFNVHLRSHYDLVNDIYAPAKYYGNTPAQLALSLGSFAYGRLFDEPKVSHLGMDLLRAQAIAESLIEPLKFAVGRERPDGSNHQSFPSGHSAATFAGATVLERHLGWKKSALAYVVAAYVASSRLHDNVHYLSDVVFGSACGVIAGRTVTQHGAEYWSFVPTTTPYGGIEILAVHVGE